ncbi:MAG TPA: hypothetical protein VN803_15545 [Gemmatimonadales bacterium]|nr:hypothetical protein [Gemmatimonadales bacterium]
MTQPSDTLVLGGERVAFPVLAFSRRLGVVNKKQNANELTATTTAGIRNGLFEDLLLVDSELQGFEITGVKVRGGVGPFWGFTPFLNRRVRVELIPGRIRPAKLDEVKGLVSESFKKWNDVWASGGDLEELKERIHRAGSLSEISQLLFREFPAR